MSARNSRDAEAARRCARQDQARAYARDPRGERQDRHTAFVHENIAEFAPAAQAAYREHGRGAFLIDCADEWSPGNAQARYATDTDVSALGGWPDDATARMVATYDPARQFVVIIREHDGISAYKFRAVPIGRGA